MSAPKRLSQREFIALIALMFATVALSIDAMLPALPEIGQALSPQDLNRAQLVVTTFVFGMGLGTLFTGPLSDTFGRKPLVLFGLALYAIGALMCYFAPSLEVLLAARILQGIGVAAPRTVSLAIVRDIYSSREMARIVSFAQMIFTTIPAIAPFLGLVMIWLAGWQSIFLAYLVFAAICALWFALRQPETLAVEARRGLSPRVLAAATAEMFRSPGMPVSILVQSLTLGMLFSTLSSIQSIFDQQMGRANNFALWFAVISILSMSGSYVNARFVTRQGMRKVLDLTYRTQFQASALLFGLYWLQILPLELAFAALVIWQTGLFAMMGTTMGNLNALALEPLGHIAGLSASVMSSIATVISVALAVPVGLAFDGTALPLIAGVTVFAGLAWALVRYGLPEGRA